MRKCVVLLLVACLLVSSLFVLNIAPVPVCAVSRPSVPQFSVKLVDKSYDVHPSSTTIIDQYTGEKTTTTTTGYHVDNKTIEVTIKTTSFLPYTDTNGITYYLYYNVQSKGRFGEDWQNWGSTVQMKNPYGGGFVSSPEYLQGSVVSGSANGYANGAQVDFRVEAIIGHYVPENPDLAFPRYWFETDVSSGWSNVQTITISDESLSSPPLQSATFPSITFDGNGQPQSPGQMQPSNSIFSNPLFMFGVGVLFAGVVIAVVLVILRRHIKTPLYTDNSSHTISGVKCSYA